jgi:Glycosyltransferase family 92
MYLSICAIYRDEAPYLREWVEFHRLVGVERFHLYNNRSVDDHLRVLAPRIDDGTVVVKDWPMYPGQHAAYNDCLGEHRDDTRWIAFIDIDEFLFSPTGAPLPEVLDGYEQWPGIGVNRLRFGTSGHKTRPAGLVIENYTYRAPLSRYLVKSIANPRRTSHCLTAHIFAYEDGVAVDENGNPLVRPEKTPDVPPEYASYTEPFTASRLRINHYATRSEEEFRRKAKRRKADTGRPPISPIPVERVLRNFALERDETIQRYLPELREAMEQVYGGVAT